MEDPRLQVLETQVATLSEALSRLRARVDRLEGAQPADAEPETAPPESAPTVSTPEVSPALNILSFVTLSGRSCLVLGGAYLLRAITQHEIVSPATGVFAGLLYGILWLFLGNRAALRGQRLGATFHGLVALIIVYPLVTEAALRFGVLSPVLAATILTALTAYGLYVAWRRQLRTLAWLVTINTAACAFVIMAKTEVAPPFLVHLLFLAAATLWIGYVDRWPGLRWIPALVLDATVWRFSTVVSGGGDHAALTMTFILALQGGMLALYLFSFTFRALVQRERLRPFEFLQTALVLAIALEGARPLVGAVPVGLIYGFLLIASIGLTVIGARRADTPDNAGFCIALISITAFETARLLLPAPLDAYAWGVFALALALHRRPPYAAACHIGAAGMLIATAIGTTMVTHATHVWIAAAAHIAPIPLAVWAPALGATGIAYATLLLNRRPEDDQWHDRCVRFAMLVLGVLVLGAVTVSTVAILLTGISPTALSTGSLGLIRTAVIVLGVVLAGTASRWFALPEARWLTIALLVAGAIKLLLEDLRLNQTTTLFLSLILYGCALLLSPRLMRAGGAATPPPTEPPSSS